MSSYEKEINNKSIEEQIRFVVRNWKNIKYIKEQTHEIQIAAVKNSMWALLKIKVPTDEACIHVFDIPFTEIKTITNLKYMLNLKNLNTPAENKEYGGPKFTKHHNSRIKELESDGRNIRFIKNQSTILQKTAIKSTPSSIEFIKSPKKLIQFEIMINHPELMHNINKPLPEIQKEIELYNKNSKSLDLKSNDSSKEKYLENLDSFKTTLEIPNIKLYCKK